ncbi:LexA repressor [uncultured Gammaproteobacteria bacterium]
MLTPKQFELLVYINERLGQSGVSPSYDEMKDALTLKSKSNIHRLILGLEERGFIRRLPHRARALEVLRLPEGIPPKRAAVVGGGADVEPAVAQVPLRGKFQPNVIRGNFSGVLAGRDSGTAGELIALPLYGRIAAGTPIEALRDHAATVDFPASLLSAGDHFALQVAGDSMIDAGILDGDTVIIHRCQNVESGAIVVALVDEHEVTLKRLRRKGQAIALEPANPNFETRIFGADRVRVQGRLIGLLRRYL